MELTMDIIRITGIAVAWAECSSIFKNFSDKGTKTEPPPAPKSPFKIPVKKPIISSLKCFLSTKIPPHFYIVWGHFKILFVSLQNTKSLKVVIKNSLAKSCVGNGDKGG